MKTVAKIEECLKKVESIRYENQHGGSYAYIQFLAYSRDLATMLRPYKNLERQLDTLEGINWLFNECLCSSFSHRHKSIFDEKMMEVRDIFRSIRSSLHRSSSNNYAEPRILHAQAA